MFGREEGEGHTCSLFQTKASPRRTDYNVYITFHSHEPEFDYLKSLEIEEKINQIRWLKRKNAAHFLLSTNGSEKTRSVSRRLARTPSRLDKTVKLWKIAEKKRRAEGYNLRDENGVIRSANNITNLRVPVIKPMELMVEATPKRVFGNAHTYHINSISLNSDQETFLSADDLRINLWHTEVTDQSFSKYRRDLCVSHQIRESEWATFFYRASYRDAIDLSPTGVIVSFRYRRYKTTQYGRSH